jgi:hypothetical protein
MTRVNYETGKPMTKEELDALDTEAQKQAEKAKKSESQKKEKQK